MTRTFAGQRADIEIEQDGTLIPVGVLEEPEVTVTKNISYLEGAGDITFQDLQQTQLRVNVSGTVSEWDLESWKTFVGYDEAADEIMTDADVPTWKTTIIYPDSQGDKAVFPVYKCHTEDVTVGGGREDWISQDFDFTGKTVKDVMAESTTAGSGSA